MKRTFKVIGFYLIWNLLIFLAISFNHLSFNINNWSDLSRFGFATLSILVGALASIFYYQFTQK